MSYNKVKNISLKKKENKIMVCNASSNVVPSTYYNSEFMSGDTDFHIKELELLRALNGGGLVLNDSCYKWRYAISKTNEELYNSKNTWKIYEDTTLQYKTYVIGDTKWSNDYIVITAEDLKSGDYEETYKGETYTTYRNKQEYKEQLDKRYEILENYYKVFMKYFKEEHNGKYYLYSQKYGYIKPKGTKGSFYYSTFGSLGVKYVMDYYKAYCIAENIGEDRQVEIRQVPTREYIPTQEQIEESKKRLTALGLDNYNYDLTISERYNVVGLKETDFDLIEQINEFETNYNAYVYHIIHGNTNLGELYNMFYVSNEKEEWKSDNSLLEQNETYAYVYNKTDSVCSEIGLIGFEKNSNLLTRTF